MSKSKHLDPRSYDPPFKFGRGFIVVVKNNDINGAMRKLKNRLNEDRVFQDLAEREYHQTKSQKRRKAKQRSIRKQQKMLRESKLDS